MVNAFLDSNRWEKDLIGPAGLTVADQKVDAVVKLGN
jgi:hypothetical protein